MKELLMCLFVVMTLNGCAAGSGSGASTVTPTPNTPVIPGVACKAINSVWTSKTDSERHDLSAFTGGPLGGFYTYAAPNGAACGASTAIVYSQLSARDTSSDSRNFDYRFDFTYSLAVGNPCVGYPGYPNGAKNQLALIKYVNCGEVQICAVDNALGVTGNMINCKTFN